MFGSWVLGQKKQKIEKELRTNFNKMENRKKIFYFFSSIFCFYLRVIIGYPTRNAKQNDEVQSTMSVGRRENEMPKNFNLHFWINALCAFPIASCLLPHTPCHVVTDVGAQLFDSLYT